MSNWCYLFNGYCSMADEYGCCRATGCVKIRSVVYEKVENFDEVNVIRSKPMDDYKERMVKEYKELKEKYNKLHKMLIKYEAGTLDFEPTCKKELLEEQAYHMGCYLKCLEVRSEIEGIGYDLLQGE